MMDFTNNDKEKLMQYFEKKLYDTVERKGDKFIIKSIQKNKPHKFRLPLLPEDDNL